MQLNWRRLSTRPDEEGANPEFQPTTPAVAAAVRRACPDFHVIVRAEGLQAKHSAPPPPSPLEGSCTAPVDLSLPP